MSPDNEEGRPRQESGLSHNITDSKSLALDAANASTNPPLIELADRSVGAAPGLRCSSPGCGMTRMTPGELTAFCDGFDVGVTAGLTVGFDQGWEAHVDQVQRRFGLALDVLDQPTLTELQQARAVDHKPCSMKCRRCSRCIHSLAYWARGRDYLGVEAERQLAEQAGNAGQVAA